MSDERDWDAFNNAQCPEFFAGWQCIREPGHSGEHRSRAVGPGMITDARPISVPESVIYISAERAILQDLIAELRELHCMTHDEWLRVRAVGQYGELLPDSWCLECRNRNGELVRWPCQTIDIADRAEARLKEVAR